MYIADSGKGSRLTFSFNITTHKTNQAQNKAYFILILDVFLADLRIAKKEMAKKI